jgi:CO/xanthine dehydrogenase Mo-binding subunit
MAPGPYQVPNARLEGYTVLTNNPICGAMRGFGVPQVTFACEQQMDLLAEQLKLDPLEIRLRNALETGSVLATGAVVRQTVGLRETVQEAAKAARWARRAELERKPAPHLRRGLGLGCCWQGTGFGANIPDSASVQVEMASDGTVLVRCGAADMGQGLSNVVVQIVAGEFTLPLERVRLIGPDTDITLDCLASEASRQTYVTGQAASRAARQLRDTLLEAAAQKLECSLEDVAFVDGEVVCYRQERSLPLPEVVGYAAGHNMPLHATGHARMTTPDPTTISYPFAHSNFSCAAQIAQVLVDIETGQVHVERVVAAHDVGRAINPLGVIGQIEGGVVMGLGGALLEDLPYVQDRGLAPSLTEFLIPTAADVPQVVPVVVEVPDPDGPYGAKGIGEQTMTPTAAAVANAVADALGVRTWTLPLTPERILAALAAK